MGTEAGTTFEIRSATARDAAPIAGIYNEGIADRIATFETRERSASDVAAWFDGGLPVLVAADDRGSIVGWAAAFPYRSRECYAGVAEISLYVTRPCRRRGAGDALMRALLAESERHGLWKVLSRIFPENEASRAMCARHGFREVGTYQRHARLDGVWRDVIIVERLLGEAERDSGFGIRGPGS